MGPLQNRGSRCHNGTFCHICHILPHRHTSGYQGNSLNHTSIWRAVSCSDTLRSSGWLRWTAERMLLKLKKIRMRDIFSSWRNFILKKKITFFLRSKKKITFFLRSKKNQHFSILKNIFVHRFFLRFFCSIIFFSTIFFQNQISPWWKNICHPDFF